MGKDKRKNSTLGIVSFVMAIVSAILPMPIILIFLMGVASVITGLIDLLRNDTSVKHFCSFFWNVNWRRLSNICSIRIFYICINWKEGTSIPLFLFACRSRRQSLYPHILPDTETIFFELCQTLMLYTDNFKCYTLFVEQ